MIRLLIIILCVCPLRLTALELPGRHEVIGWYNRAGLVVTNGHGDRFLATPTGIHPVADSDLAKGGFVVINNNISFTASVIQSYTNFGVNGIRSIVAADGFALLISWENSIDVVFTDKAGGLRALRLTPRKPVVGGVVTEDNRRFVILADGDIDAIEVDDAGSPRLVPYFKTQERAEITAIHSFRNTLYTGGEEGVLYSISLLTPPIISKRKITNSGFIDWIQHLDDGKVQCIVGSVTKLDVSGQTPKVIDRKGGSIKFTVNAKDPSQRIEEAGINDADIPLEVHAFGQVAFTAFPSRLVIH